MSKQKVDKKKKGKKTRSEPREALAPAVGAVVAARAFDHLAEAVGVYLSAVGWKVLVVGAPRIQHQPNDRQFNFEFVVCFTGAQKRPTVGGGE